MVCIERELLDAPVRLLGAGSKEEVATWRFSSCGASVLSQMPASSNGVVQWSIISNKFDCWWQLHISKHITNLQALSASRADHEIAASVVEGVFLQLVTASLTIVES